MLDLARYLLADLCPDGSSLGGQADWGLSKGDDSLELKLFCMFAMQRLGDSRSVDMYSDMPIDCEQRERAVDTRVAYVA